MVDAGNIETSESSSLTPTTVRNFGLSDSKSVYFEVKVRDTNRGLLRISTKIKLKANLQDIIFMERPTCNLWFAANF